MDKTLKINIAGVVFQIEEDAFEILRNYLQALNSRFKNLPEGNETIEDIESRIAEIFQSQKGLAGIISKDNIEAMISIIGKPEELGGAEEHDTFPFYSARRRKLYRNQDDSIISGVCGGIGAYLNTDSVWIRILFILFTCFFGIGFFVYIALWIALPSAITDNQKRDLYGDYYYAEGGRKKSSASAGHHEGISSVGNAFNEIFSAIGKCIVIFVRIILIIIGVAFVIAGFLTLLSFIVLFFFKYPGLIQSATFNSDVLYLPDYLNYFFTPAVTPWVIVLICMAVALPLLAIIYWGIKMIFQFRAKDGVLSLVILMIWIASLVLLSTVFFSRGLGFAETGRNAESIIMKTRPDTLHISVDHKLSAVRYDREIYIPGENFRLGLNSTTKELYIQSKIDFEKSEDGILKIEVLKSSQGRTKTVATEKAEKLLYNYRVSNDTLYADEYYIVTPEYKWSGSFLRMNIFLPVGQIVAIDQSGENLLRDYGFNDDYSSETALSTWQMTDNGLVPSEK
jgi:phage shock protein PspC (stress-responsive transcriptional regulator)